MIYIFDLDVTTDKLELRAVLHDHNFTADRIQLTGACQLDTYIALRTHKSSVMQ
jgi:hypothetical protein